MLKKQEKFKILLLSLPIGSGHTIAAQALAKELEKYNVETKHLNVFEYIPKFLTAIFMQAYLLSLRISPQIYSFLYKWGNKDNKSTFSRDLLNAYIARRAYRDICHWQPDLIIATHATAAGIVAQMKQQRQLKAPLIGVVTDYTMHNWWYYPEVAEYYLPDINLDKIMFSENQRIFKFGIPLRQEFSQPAANNKKLLLAKWQIKTSNKTCLLLGGGEGLLPMLEIIKALKANKDLTFIAVTGNNETLYRQIQNIKDVSIYNYRFVEKIVELIELADVVISKAGGLSSTEIISRQVPYIIYKPLPGQERKNAEYLQEMYGAEIVEQEENLSEKVNCLLCGVRRQAKKELNLTSTRLICSKILQHFCKN